MAYAWALDRSVTKSEMAKRHLRLLDGEMARYGEEWSLAEIAAAANDRRPLPQPTSSMAVAALRTAQEEAERIIRER